jgi:UDP-N-acetylmuramyl pentapeptide synthase
LQRSVVGPVVSPTERWRLLNRINPLGWRLVGPMAAVYRRTVVPATRVAAVVGSMGKSTTARAVHAALGLPLRRRIESNYLSQVALSVLAIRPGDRRAVVEVGIQRPGEMARYAAVVRPDTVVATWIGTEHRTSLQTLANTRQEKARMVEALPPGGLAILNADDPRILWMAGRTRARAMTYGLSSGADVRAEDVRLDWPRGTAFRLRAGGRTRDVRIRLLGRHQVYPALAAIAVASAEGVDLDEAIGRVERLAPTRGRLSPVHLECGAVLLEDDWKGAIEAFEAALRTFAQVPARRRIVVLGAVSELYRKRGTTYQRLGELAARTASLIVFCGPTERFRSLRVGAMRGGMPEEAIVHVGRNVRDIPEALPTDLGPGDVVLIKGGQAQRLERVGAALTGRTVRCRRRWCRAKMVRCLECPELEA